MDTYSNLISVMGKNININTEELSLLIKDNFKCRHYKKGAFFARQGELSDKIGFNIGGILSMQVVRADGTEYIKSFIKPNDFILATFDENKPNPVSIQAINNSTVLEAKFSDVKVLFDRHPELALFYRKEVEKVTELIYLRLEQIATLDSKKRYKVFQDEFSDFEDTIPQYLIASYLGITPTQLSRIRKSINKCK